MVNATSLGTEVYAAAFERERLVEYPIIDAHEHRMGFSLDRSRLESAARILACPIKPSPPSWQHGRVVYATTRSYLTNWNATGATLLDIGSGKGFSALCLQWALNDSGYIGAVVSVDVLDPVKTERRNSVAECDGLKTLAQFLAPWPEAQAITFLQSTGVDWLNSHPVRVHVAFVDGKHSGAVVYKEGQLLAREQVPNDIAIFDDVQIDGVGAAVKQLRKYYEFEFMTISASRTYAIGVRL